MSIYLYRTAIIGQGSTPTGELIAGAAITGLSIGKGDASDSNADPLLTTEANIFVGWTTGQHRGEALYYLALPSRIKRSSRVVGATLYLWVYGSAWPANVVDVATGGTNWVDVYAVRRAIGSTFTGMTWVNYFTGSAWDQNGINFGVGPDTDGVALASFQWNQADHDAINAGVTKVLKTLTGLRAEFERLLAFDEPLRLAFKARWAAFGGSTPRNISLDLPTQRPTVVHTYVILQYRQPLEFYGSSGAGTVDQTNLKDFNSSGIDQHLFLGTPSLGATGSVLRFFVRNEATSAQPAVMVVTGGTLMGSIDQSGVVGSGRLRYVRGYQTTGSTQTPTGRWRFVFTAATTFDVKFTPDGSSTETTVQSGVSTGANTVVVYNALNALNILSAGFSGTFASGDVLAFDTRGDLHTTSIPLSSLDLMRLAPHAAGDRTTAFSTKPRVASRAVACQLYRHDTSTIANSGGATGVCANVTDGANSGTHVKVPDTTLWTEGDYVTLANFTALDETVGGVVPRVEQVRIKTVYSMTDADYPGQLLFYETLTNPTDFDGNAILCGGVWLGRLDTADQAFLAVQASPANNQITLDATPTRTSGTLTLIDPTSGTTETKTIDSYPGGQVLQLTAAPGYAYPVGSFVYFADETKSNVPFYMWGQPPTSTARGRKLGYITAMSWSIT